MLEETPEGTLKRADLQAQVEVVRQQIASFESGLFESCLAEIPDSKRHTMRVVFANRVIDLPPELRVIPWSKAELASFRAQATELIRLRRIDDGLASDVRPDAWDRYEVLRAATAIEANGEALQAAWNEQLDALVD